MRKILFSILLILIATALFFAYRYNFIPHRSYSDANFNIEPYISEFDADGDGIDDQTDILNSAKTYIASRPKYKSEYYDGGYPDGEYGVCTDVVAFSLLGSGYDLMELVNADILANPDAYDIERADKNIDFRRVRNLLVYFNNNAQPLTTDVYDIGEWHGGDIVVFKEHIGIVSDKRNRNGVPFLIHHAYPGQPRYEEDVLERYNVIGHFRIN